MHINVHGTLTHDPCFLFGITLCIFFMLVSLLGPLLAPFSPWNMDFIPLSPPSSIHLLGVNDGGQDIFSELLHAIRNTMVFGIISASAALVMGVLLGTAAGWFGGVVDLLLMRLADVFLATPAIMILILVAALFRPSPYVLALILSGLMWPTIGKTIRAQTLTLKQSLHVRAAYHPASHPGDVPFVSHRVCSKGPHGHVHGSVPRFSGPSGPQSEIVGDDDQLRHSILLYGYLVALALSPHRLFVPADHDGHIFSHQYGKGDGPAFEAEPAREDLMTLMIQDFSVVYRDGDHSIQAVEEATLEIKGGACLALVGESGSGKTTLGKACLGMLPENAETEGRIFLNNQEIDFADETSLNQMRWQNIAMVFQNGSESLNPAYRIIDQVAEPVMAKIENRLWSELPVRFFIWVCPNPAMPGIPIN